MAKRLTGNFVIDPSTISISGLYNTAKNDLTWNRDVLDISGIPEDKLPDLVHSYEPAGLTVSQVYALAHAADERYRVLVLLAAFRSLRRGELAALRRSDRDIAFRQGGRPAIIASIGRRE